MHQKIKNIPKIIHEYRWMENTEPSRPLHLSAPIWYLYVVTCTVRQTTSKDFYAAPMGAYPLVMEQQM